jgi:hypothetical protein
MSVAFTREESAETAAEVELPDRPISLHPNLVTESGLEVLANALAESHATYNAAQQIEDAGRTSSRSRGRLSRNKIFRSSEDSSGRSAAGGVRYSHVWA